MQAELSEQFSQGVEGKSDYRSTTKVTLAGFCGKGARTQLEKGLEPNVVTFCQNKQKITKTRTVGCLLGEGLLLRPGFPVLTSYWLTFTY